MCADPSKADFWMVAKEIDLLAMTRSNIVPIALIIIRTNVVCSLCSFEIAFLTFYYLGSNIIQDQDSNISNETLFFFIAIAMMATVNKDSN